MKYLIKFYEVKKMLLKEQNSKTTRGYFIISISLLFLLLQGCSSVSLIPDQMFDDISTYEIGQDRSKLSEFSSLIDTLSQSEEKRLLAENDLLDFLTTDATFDSKQFVCRELRIIGTEKSVPTLTEMLLDEKTTDIARYALEDIPGEAVDKALIELLPNATKKVQLGIMNTLAVRKSASSVSTISALLKSTDDDISTTAASALGQIGNEECIKVLTPYLNSKNKVLRNSVLDSYLLCVDELVTQNKMKEANKFYTDLHNQDIPFIIKQATLVGIINSSENKSTEILERIKSEPNELRSIPISKIRELPENSDITNFAKLLPTLKPGNQIQLLSVIEDRGDKSVKPHVLKTLDACIMEVRIASIRTLTNIGDDTDVIKLATIAATKTGDEARYARTALDLLSGDKVNQTITNSIATSNNGIRIELIKAVGTRNINSAFSSIIEYANSADNKTKTATLKSLADISTIDNVPALIDILIAQQSNSDRKKVERTISKVLAKFPNTNGSTPIIKKINSDINKDNNSSLLRLLGFTGDAAAFKVLRIELKSSDEQIKIAAINGLSNWTSAKPLGDLRRHTIMAKNDKVRAPALKGFTKFISMDNSLTDEQKVEMYKISLQFSKSSNERNIALDGIGHIDCFASLETIKLYVNQPDVKQTVDDGINRVSWHMFEKDPERVKNYVLWFLSKVKDERFQKKNTQLLEVIDRHIASRDANK